MSGKSSSKANLKSSLKSAKAAARGAIDATSAMIAKVQVRRLAKNSGSVLVLDIDNTIADTWPTYAKSWGSESERLRSIPPIEVVRTQVHDRAVAEGRRVVFLTHRHLWQWRVTFDWLRANRFAVTPANLVLVPSAAAKVPLIRVLAAAGAVDYWDDLSYGHERGGPFFYEEAIAQLRTIAVDYYGWDEICALRSDGGHETQGAAR